MPKRAEADIAWASWNQSEARRITAAVRFWIEEEFDGGALGHEIDRLNSIAI